MRVSMGQRRGTPALPSWFRARCARSSMSRRSSRTRSATTWNAAIRSSSRRWRRFCASIAKSSSSRRRRQRQNKNRAMRWRLSSYDEKPGIQAIAATAPDLPPEPGRHATFARDYESRRHGTVSLLAGIDLLTGQVHALVKDRHRSREFIEFLKLLDAAYPTHTAIKLILDNHSAHISKQT